MIFTTYSSPIILCQGVVSLFHCHPMMCVAFILSYTSQGWFTRKIPGFTPMTQYLPHGPTHTSHLSFVTTSSKNFCKVSLLYGRICPMGQHRTHLPPLLSHIGMASLPKNARYPYCRSIVSLWENTVLSSLLCLSNTLLYSFLYCYMYGRITFVF